MEEPLIGKHQWYSYDPTAADRFAEMLDRTFAPLMKTLAMLEQSMARSVAREKEHADEVSEWVAEIDTKIGRLAAIVADHEERLGA